MTQDKPKSPDEIIFPCAQCGKLWKASAEMIGEQFECESCSTINLVPARSVDSQAHHPAPPAPPQSPAPPVPSSPSSPPAPELDLENEGVIKDFARRFDAICSEVEKVIVGLRPTIEDVMIAIMAEGNALLEGVPGLGKTYLIKTLGQVLNLQFRRVQFTVDLMPSDIIGTNLLVQDEHGKRLQFQRGPIFTNLLLADEINRATPKTQAALLEAMEEHNVTVGGKTNRLDEPFFVLATQNPIEQDGTYPLPVAQLDKFIFKLLVGYPTEADLVEIVMRTTFERYPEVHQVVSQEEILGMRRLVRQVPVASHVEEFAMRLIRATHPESPHATETSKKYIEKGSGPRGLLSVLHAAKARALSRQQPFVGMEDVNAVALQVLRHRVKRSLEAEADDMGVDQIIRQIMTEISASMQKEKTA